jgi:hypothetical protein
VGLAPGAAFGAAGVDPGAPGAAGTAVAGVLARKPGRATMPLRTRFVRAGERAPLGVSRGATTTGDELRGALDDCAADASGSSSGRAINAAMAGRMTSV